MMHWDGRADKTRWVEGIAPEDLEIWLFLRHLVAQELLARLDNWTYVESLSSETFSKEWGTLDLDQVVRGATAIFRVPSKAPTQSPQSLLITSWEYCLGKPLSQDELALWDQIFSHANSIGMSVLLWDGTLDALFNPIQSTENLQLRLKSLVNPIAISQDVCILKINHWGQNASAFVILDHPTLQGWFAQAYTTAKTKAQEIVGYQNITDHDGEFLALLDQQIPAREFSSQACQEIDTALFTENAHNVAQISACIHQLSSQAILCIRAMTAYTLFAHIDERTWPEISGITFTNMDTMQVKNWFQALVKQVPEFVQHLQQLTFEQVHGSWENMQFSQFSALTCVKFHACDHNSSAAIAPQLNDCTQLTRIIIISAPRPLLSNIRNYNSRGNNMGVIEDNMPVWDLVDLLPLRQLVRLELETRLHCSRELQVDRQWPTLQCLRLVDIRLFCRDEPTNNTIHGLAQLPLLRELDLRIPHLMQETILWFVDHNNLNKLKLCKFKCVCIERCPSLQVLTCDEGNIYTLQRVDSLSSLTLLSCNFESCVIISFAFLRFCPLKQLILNLDKKTIVNFPAQLDFLEKLETPRGELLTNDGDYPKTPQLMQLYFNHYRLEAIPAEWTPPTLRTLSINAQYITMNTIGQLPLKLHVLWLENLAQFSLTNPPLFQCTLKILFVNDQYYAPHANPSSDPGYALKQKLPLIKKLSFLWWQEQTDQPIQRTRIFERNSQNQIVVYLHKSANTLVDMGVGLGEDNNSIRELYFSSSKLQSSLVYCPIRALVLEWEKHGPDHAATPKKSIYSRVRSLYLANLPTSELSGISRLKLLENLQRLTININHSNDQIKNNFEINHLVEFKHLQVLKIENTRFKHGKFNGVLNSNPCLRHVLLYNCYIGDHDDNQAIQFTTNNQRTCLQIIDCYCGIIYFSAPAVQLEVVDCPIVPSINFPINMQDSVTGCNPDAAIRSLVVANCVCDLKAVFFLNLPVKIKSISTTSAWQTKSAAVSNLLFHDEAGDQDAAFTQIERNGSAWSSAGTRQMPDRSALQQILRNQQNQIFECDTNTQPLDTPPTLHAPTNFVGYGQQYFNPSDVRLHILTQIVYNQAAGQIFLQQPEPTLRLINSPMTAAYSSLCPENLPSEQYYYGEAAIEIRADTWSPLPSPCCEHEITLVSQEQAKLCIWAWSDRQSQYFVRLNPEKTTSSRLTCIMRYFVRSGLNFDIAASTPPALSNDQLPQAIGEGLAGLIAALPVSEPLRKLHQDIHRHWEEYRTTAEIIRLIIKYCSDFVEADKEKMPEEIAALALPHFLQEFLQLIMKQSGVCRHRTTAFLVLAQFFFDEINFSLACRGIQNWVHMKVEVHNPDTQSWYSVDLGGGAATLIDEPLISTLCENYPKLAPALPPKLLQLQDTVLDQAISEVFSEIEKKDSILPAQAAEDFSIEDPVIAADEQEEEEDSNLSETDFWNMLHLPTHSRKDNPCILLKFPDQESLEAFSKLLFFHLCEQHGKAAAVERFLLIHTAKEMDSLYKVAHIDEQNQAHSIPGPLQNKLKRADSLVTIVFNPHFSLEMMEIYKSLLDTHPTIDGEVLSARPPIIGCILKKKCLSAAPSVAFYRRWPQTITISQELGEQIKARVTTLESVHATPSDSDPIDSPLFDQPISQQEVPTESEHTIPSCEVVEENTQTMPEHALPPLNLYSGVVEDWQAALIGRIAVSAPPPEKTTELQIPPDQAVQQSLHKHAQQQQDYFQFIPGLVPQALRINQAGITIINAPTPKENPQFWFLMEDLYKIGVLVNGEMINIPSSFSIQFLQNTQITLNPQQIHIKRLDQSSTTRLEQPAFIINRQTYPGLFADTGLDDHGYLASIRPLVLTLHHFWVTEELPLGHWQRLLDEIAKTQNDYVIEISPQADQDYLPVSCPCIEEPTPSSAPILDETSDFCLPTILVTQDISHTLFSKTQQTPDAFLIPVDVHMHWSDLIVQTTRCPASTPTDATDTIPSDIHTSAVTRIQYQWTPCDFFQRIISGSKQPIILYGNLSDTLFRQLESLWTSNPPGIWLNGKFYHCQAPVIWITNADPKNKFSIARQIADNLSFADLESTLTSTCAVASDHGSLNILLNLFRLYVTKKLQNLLNPSQKKDSLLFLETWVLAAQAFQQSPDVPHWEIVKQYILNHLPRNSENYAIFSLYAKLMLADRELLPPAKQSASLKIEKLQKLIKHIQISHLQNNWIKYFSHYCWHFLNCCSPATLHTLFAITATQLIENPEKWPLTAAQTVTLQETVISHIKSHTEPAVSDRWEKQVKQVKEFLQNPAGSHLLVIHGPPGCGKTHLMHELANTQPFFGETAIAAWLAADASAVQKALLVLDEYNLEAEEKWQFLRGMRQNTPGVYHQGHFIPVTPWHFVCLPGNTRQIGRKFHHIPARVIFFKPHTDQFILRRIAFLTGLPEASEAAHFFLENYRFVQRLIPKQSISLRHVDMLCLRFQALSRSMPEQSTLIKLQHAFLQQYYLMFNETNAVLRKRFLQQITGNEAAIESDIPWLTISGRSALGTSHEYIVTESRVGPVVLLQEFLKLRVMDIKGEACCTGQRGILAAGDSGIGKSELFLQVLLAAGFQNGFAFLPKDSKFDLSKFDFDASSQAEYYFHITMNSQNLNLYNILLYAFHLGGVVILDEINLGFTPDIERLLNHLLCGYDPAGNLPKRRGFRVFASLNPSSKREFFAGRSNLSPALADRFVPMNLQAYPMKELVAIACAKGHSLEKAQACLRSLQEKTPNKAVNLSSYLFALEAWGVSEIFTSGACANPPQISVDYGSQTTPLQENPIGNRF